MLCSQTPLLNIICNRDFLLRSAMISEHACYPLNQSDATSEWKGIWPGLSFSVLERPEYLRDWCACLILLIFTLLVLICRYDFLGSVLSPSIVILLTSTPFSITTNPRASSCVMEEDKGVRFLLAEHTGFTPLAILSFLVACTSALEVPNCLAISQACTYTLWKGFEVQATGNECVARGIMVISWFDPFLLYAPLVYLGRRRCVVWWRRRTWT